MAVGASGCGSLEALREHIGDCRRCPLGETRTCLVFGVGDPHADLMFIGEAPGRQEDLGGEPFIGAAGKLLDELLASIGLKRDQVYIANVLKCRPPGNRDPQSDEIAQCAEFLSEQIRLIDPKVIAPLGNFATKFVLGTQRGITELRGKLYRVGGRQVVPIFHPAAALYTPAKRDTLFEDFRRLRAVIDRTPGHGHDACDDMDGEHVEPAAERDGSSEHAEPTLFDQEQERRVELVLRTGSEDETREAGRVLAGLLEPGDVLALTGDLGAGKTQLTKGIGTGLGVCEAVVSPTFNILLVHEGRLALYHFDLYRLEAAAQLEDVDFFGMLEAGGVSVIEWGERFPEALPTDHLAVVMRITGDASREITLVPGGPRSAALAAAWDASLKGGAS